MKSYTDRKVSPPHDEKHSGHTVEQLQEPRQFARRHWAMLWNDAAWVGQISPGLGVRTKPTKQASKPANQFFNIRCVGSNLSSSRTWAGLEIGGRTVCKLRFSLFLGSSRRQRRKKRPSQCMDVKVYPRTGGGWQ